VRKKRSGKKSTDNSTTKPIPPRFHFGKSISSMTLKDVREARISLEKEDWDPKDSKRVEEALTRRERNLNFQDGARSRNDRIV
jgi:hypothetical protein